VPSVDIPNNLATPNCSVLPCGKLKPYLWKTSSTSVERMGNLWGKEIQRIRIAKKLKKSEIVEYPDA